MFVVGLAGLSPAALDLFRGDAKSWERLSFIGQTYGAASALLSAFALIGIAATLILQARDTKVSREQGRRALHVDLLKMALENPLYRRAWGYLDPADDPDIDRQNLYINLMLSEWQMSFELKMLDERHLRVLAKGLFQGEGGRRFWIVAREHRISTSATRRERRFHQIVDDEYRAAEEQGPPRPDPEPHRDPAIVRHRELLAGIILGGIGVVIVGRLRRIAPRTRRRNR
ncbi:DUF6082 family protein [Actinomadura sp. 9N215]|uniref:DUF6082 family protein n=1 Tax=Actinomadura sp. 9N215 TaxID=3375150 RepID=UPI0037B1C217